MAPSVARSWRARPPLPPPPDWDGICRREMGPEVVQYLYDSMAIDDEWSVRNERGFSWWAHRLKQAVRALRPVRDGEFLLTPVVICTDFLADVPDRPRTLECLDALNMQAVMHAWVWNRRRRKIKLLTVGVVNEQNAHWQSRQLLGSVGIQCQLAHELAERWAALVEARPDWSAHPVSGPRQEPDDMLNVLEDCFLPVGEQMSRFSQEDLGRTVANLRAAGLLSYEGRDGLSAEFPFLGWKTAIMNLIDRHRLGRPGGPLQTSLFQCYRSVKHPRLGSGLFALLQTPIPIADDLGWARRFAAHLNRRWRDGQGLFPRWGAWCVNSHQRTLAYVMFTPNFLWAPGLALWVGHNFLRANDFASRELLPYSRIDPPPSAVIDASVQILLEDW